MIGFGKDYIKKYFMNKILTSKVNLGQFENKSLLIVDDDDPFRNRLSKAMENKAVLQSLKCI